MNDQEKHDEALKNAIEKNKIGVTGPGKKLAFIQKEAEKENTQEL